MCACASLHACIGVLKPLTLNPKPQFPNPNPRNPNDRNETCTYTDDCWPKCDPIYQDMKPGAKVLYLGAASGTTVSHVSDIVGENGHVYAVEFSKRCGRDLVNLAKQRTNIHPIIEDARKPTRYRMLVDMVDCVFADVAQPDQGRIMAINCKWFLKNGGHFVISIKVIPHLYFHF